MRYSKTRIVSTLLLLSILIGQAAAVDLIGNVTDTDGAVITTATIYINGSTDSTDATGMYNVTGLNAGNYTAYADADGYYRSIESVELTVNYTEQNFTLTAPNYTASDLDDIGIDLVATGMVEVKGELPTIVDLGIAYYILLIIAAIIGAAVGIFFIHETMKKKRRRS